MEKIIYLMPCTDDTEQLFNEHGVDGLIEDENDIADYTLCKVRIGNKNDIISAIYNVSQYGTYHLLSEKEYNKVKRG